MSGASRLLREALAARLARREGRALASRPRGTITSDPNGDPLHGLDTTPSASDPVAMRMERARRLGFDTETPLYHGTDGDVTAFRNDNGPTFLTPSAREASAYALNDTAATSYARLSPRDGNPNVMPLFARGRMFGERAALSADELDAVDALAAQSGHWQRGEFARSFDRSYPPTGSNVLNTYSSVGAEQTELLRSLGYAGRITHDGQRVVFNPSNIRSRFAAFDPARSNSSDLLAGLAIGVPAGGLTLREVLRDQYGERA